MKRFLCTGLCSLLFALPLLAQKKTNDFALLTPGKTISGFKTTSLYFNDIGQSMGSGLCTIAQDSRLIYCK